MWESVVNSFELLPEEQKAYLLEQRASLNATLSMTLEELQARFFLKYIADEWFLLFDLEANRRVGYVNFSYIRDEVMYLHTYGIEPLYQGYGLSTLMLWLFYEKMLPKIAKETGTPITQVARWTQLIKPHITESSYKYFDYADWRFSQPDMAAIRDAVYHKMQSPHVRFTSGTSHIHMGKYSF